jgi:uncharacterized protein involved in type VI secretion and phage assembly
MPCQSNLQFTLTPAGRQTAFDVSDTLTEGLLQLFQLPLHLSSYDPDIDFVGLLDNAVLHGKQRSEIKKSREAQCSLMVSLQPYAAAEGLS